MTSYPLRFWIKLTTLGGLVIAAQLLSRVVYTGDEDANIVRMRQLLQDGVDVLYFGDSVNFIVDPDDDDDRSISRMLDSLTPELSVAAIDHPAYHLRVFESFVDALAEQPRRPRAVVIPVNLRSFSPSWDRFPQYQFTDVRRELKYGILWRAVEKPLRTFHVLDDFREVSWETYETTPVYSGTKKVGVVRDFDNPSYRRATRENRRNKFILEYMAAVSPDHRLLLALRRIAARARELNITPLFYLTPIDVETGTRFVGPSFTRQIEANAQTIRSQLKDVNPPPLDLSLSLPADRFHYASVYPNEHLDEAGRMFVAEQLAQSLQRLPPDPRPKPRPSPAG